MEFSHLIREIPDFPKPGILFRDMSPLLADSKTFSLLLEQFYQKILRDHKFDALVGIEARGFVLAAALASKNNYGFIPMRKKGKLPPPTVSHSYSLEYGQDTLELVKSDKPLRIAIVDDVLATGGTLQAAIELCKKAGYQVATVGVLIDLKSLNSMTFNGQPIPSLISY